MSGLNTKISEVINSIEPGYRELIIGVLNREGKEVNGTTINEMLNTVPRDKLTKDELLAMCYLMNWDSNKFAAKLNFSERCEILALSKSGFSRETLASMYGINRRTVTHICNVNSKHYKNVREEEKMMGTQHFIDKFLSPGHIEKAMAFRQDQAGKAQENNKFANAKAGIHVVRGTNCTVEHRVIIQWIEDDKGWYYRDLDSDFPEDWFCSPDKNSCKTSQSCYAHMLGDIMDKLPI